MHEIGRIWACRRPLATRPIFGAQNLRTKPTGVRNAASRFVGGREKAMATIAYARVSTGEQNPEYQVQQLRDAGAEKVFVDHGESSTTRNRPQWVACQDYLRQGDVLLVHRLDRLSGSWHLFQLLLDLGERGIDVRSLTEPVIDTTTPMGKAMYGIVAVFAQLRIDTIRENTRAGLAHARTQGRVGGRPSVITPEKFDAAVRLRDAGQNHSQIAAALDVSRMSVSRALSKVERGQLA